MGIGRRRLKLTTMVLLGVLLAGCSAPSPPQVPTPTLSGWDELDPASPTPNAPSPSPTPTEPSPVPRPEPSDPSPSSPCPTGTPISAGRMSAGSLSITVPDGWHYDLWRSFDWIGCPAILDKVIVDSWYADLKLGEATSTRPSVKMLAEDISAVATQDLFPRDVVDVRQVHSRSATVDGHKAWWVRREIRVEVGNPTITGDRLDIVVVDVAPGKQSIFVGVAPLWDKAVQATVDRARTSLRLE